MTDSDFAPLESDAPTPSKRELNMRRRRERMSLSAAQIIVDEGIDNLTLSKVAAMSDLTVPTIHNLFGKKRDIYTYLAKQVSDWMVNHVNVLNSAKTFDDMESGINLLVETVQIREVEFKAGLLAGERYSRPGMVEVPYNMASTMTATKFASLFKSGVLVGKIAPECMAKLVNDQVRIQRIDWMRGAISLDKFTHEIFLAFYVVLLADATPKFRKKLHARIASIGK